MNPATILIVDHNPEDLTVLAQILAPDHRLAFAWTGRDALAAARRHQPVLILLDTELPDLDGPAVYRQLQADPATSVIPVIFVTVPKEPGSQPAVLRAIGAPLVKPVSAPQVRAHVRRFLSAGQHARVEPGYADVMRMLNQASHFRDDETGEHPWRMAAYAAALAESAGWDAESCKLMGMAAALHDIGKLGIPDTILLKPLKLDPDEWETMKTHCQIGHEILAKHEGPVFQLGATIALNHHEHWDGTGYPNQLAGEAIPEAARIVAIVDVFDALTMKRPYREAWPVEAAVATLRRGAGSHFEPRLVSVFESILPRILDIKALSEAQELEALAL